MLDFKLQVNFAKTPLIYGQFNKKIIIYLDGPTYFSKFFNNNYG